VSDDNEVELAMSVPLDDDGFLRRACPTCDREFKWLPSSNESATNEPSDEPSHEGYFCPYCGVQSDQNEWLTQAQVELAQSLVARQVVAPMLQDFARQTRRSSGLMRIDVNYTVEDEPDPLIEPNDMRRVDYSCHPSEPLKIDEDWTRAVYCLVCGSVAN
jgi:hypothetical protein